MKKAVRFYSVLVLISLLMLSLSSMADTPFSDILYVCAFAAPLVVGEFYAKTLKRRREEEKNTVIPYNSHLGIKTDGVMLSLPTVIPTVAAVSLVAAFSAWFIGLFGYASASVYEGSLVSLIVGFALVPAFFEELLFRYLPMKILLPYSPRATIAVSSLLFGFYHMDILKIPYAIVAGLIFMTVDIIADSAIPSLVIHFLNNSLSLFTMKYAGRGEILVPLYAVFALLLAVSLALIVIKRKSYKQALLSALAKGEEYTYDISLFVLPIVGILYTALSFLK